MSHVLFFLVIIAMLAVLGVLGAGIFSLVRGGTFRENWSNKLMQLRVVLQAVAIALLLALAWAWNHHL